MVGFDYTGKEKEKKKHGEDYTEKKSRELRERERQVWKTANFNCDISCEKEIDPEVESYNISSKRKKKTTFRHLVAGENIFLLLLYYIVYHSIYIGARPHDFYT